MNRDHYIIKDSIDEKELWRRFQKGDTGAYEKIFKAYYRDLYGYGLKLCHKPELTRDTIQELYVTLWERKEHLSRVDSIKAYLLASLRRMILRVLNRKRSRQPLLEDHYREAEQIQFSAEEILVRDEMQFEQKRRLKEAIDHLSDRQKEVLYLRYYNGMSYNEIEDILSINYQSIRNHIYRATKKLREIFEEKMYKVVGSLLVLIKVMF